MTSFIGLDMAWQIDGNHSGILIGSPTLTEVLDRDPAGLAGKAPKRYEDTLDAIFCAYLAWHCRRWG